MPPSGFNKNVVEGALAFAKGCYLDLLDEVRSGKHATYEEAIEYELGQIERVLRRIHITADGDLVFVGDFISKDVNLPDLTAE
jgi:hypothetical protein